MNKEPITLHLETFNDKEYILADECIKAIGIHRKTNTKLHKEIERLNNIIEKVLFILEHMKDNRVGYEVCIDLLKGEDKE